MGVDPGSSSGDERDQIWNKFLKVEPTRYADGLDGRSERRVKDGLSTKGWGCCLPG